MEPMMPCRTSFVCRTMLPSLWYYQLPNIKRRPAGQANFCRIISLLLISACYILFNAGGRRNQAVKKDRHHSSCGAFEPKGLAGQGCRSSREYPRKGRCGPRSSARAVKPDGTVTEPAAQIPSSRASKASRDGMRRRQGFGWRSGGITGECEWRENRRRAGSRSGKPTWPGSGTVPAAAMTSRPGSITGMCTGMTCCSTVTRPTLTSCNGLCFRTSEKP